MDPNVRTPLVRQWSAGLQQGFGGHLLEARYVGNATNSLLRAENINPQQYTPGFLNDFNGIRAALFSGRALPPSALTNATQTLDLSSLFLTNSAAEVLYFLHAFSQYFGVEVAQQALDAYEMNLPNRAAFAGVNVLRNQGFASYHALQLDARNSNWRGLNYQVNYTFGKALTNGVGAQTRLTDDFSLPVRDPRYPDLDRARSPYDLTHSFRFLGFYAIPAGKLQGSWKTLLGGWNVSTFVVAQSGAPYSVLSNWSTVSEGTGNTVDSFADGGALREAMSQLREGPFGPLVGPSGVVSNLFGFPGAGRLGTLQPDFFTGPTAFRTDLGIQKTFRVRERWSANFRAEAVNAFNTTSFAVNDQELVPGITGLQPTPTLAGVVSSTVYRPRRVQLSMTVQF